MVFTWCHQQKVHLRMSCTECSQEKQVYRGRLNRVNRPLIDYDSNIKQYALYRVEHSTFFCPDKKDGNNRRDI